MFQVLLVAFGLSIDAFAVSVSAGMGIERIQFRHILRGSLSFGLFQCFMPLLGFYCLRRFQWLLDSVDHWIAFSLLFLLGGKMLFEARNTIEDRFCEDLENSSILPESYSRIARIDIRQGKPLFLLSIATRIDTLAIGITFSVLGHSIFEVVLVIGIITFFVCMKGRSYGSILSGKP
ncbi:MAG: manganese efflux pump MntP family protein [Spirochaetes bacterium]|nr:manganese efflux pump MntP family protein [Spirochaetota bacterium]